MKTLKLAFIILTIFCPSMADAWSYHTHRKITADALNNLPKHYRAIFIKYKNSFLKGSTNPDTILKDFNNHAYHPDGSHPDGLYRLEALFDRATMLIKKNEDPQKIAYIFGLMSHYIADLNQPLHTAGSRIDPAESDYHSKFERGLNKYLKDFTSDVKNFKPVTSVETRLVDMTNEALKHYKEIQTAFRSGNGVLDVLDMAKTQYKASVQNILDYWLGAYLAADRLLPQHLKEK